MYIKRTIEHTILQIGESFPSLVIYGPRQVGKSTTVNKLFGTQYRSVTLDDIDDYNLAVENPKLFIETYGWPLIIDEIQKAPLLLNEIKKQIDQQRLAWMANDEPRQLMYILTGSNRFKLQQGISDSLAGRSGIIDMASFSQMEKYNIPAQLFTPDYKILLQRERESSATYRTRAEIFEDIFQGGMPDICTGVSERDIYYQSYISTYIEKDVRKLIAATSEIQFRNFISIIALRTAQELKYSEIASTVGIDVRTCKSWLSILETSGIIYLLQPYANNATHRVVKTPKIYFMDTGLCAYLCKWPTAEMLSNSAMNGAFFETYVVSELIKNFYAFNKNPKDYFYYYRDSNQKEVDLLYVEQNRMYPIEIKAGTSPKNPTKNFSVLTKYKMDIQMGLIIDTSDKMRPVNNEAFSYPIYLLGS